MITKEIHSQNT